MDRESLTLQIENMKFQSKMERWPLSKSIEAWVSTRVLQFWHQSALWPSLSCFVDISCMSKSKLENSNSVCTNKMQSDLIEGVLNFCLFFLASKWLCQLHRYQEYLDGWILILIVFFRISILNFSSLSFSLFIKLRRTTAFNADELSYFKNLLKCFSTLFHF